MHQAEGTEHFHSLKTTRWLVARKSTLVFRQEHIRPAIYPSISESPRLRICLSTRTPALQIQLLVRTGTSSFFQIGICPLSKVTLSINYSITENY